LPLLSLLSANFHNFFAQAHYRKFVTGGYIVSPPNMVYVTTLPCSRWRDFSDA